MQCCSDRDTMVNVLLDANFLLLPFQYNVDIFSELDRLVGTRYDVYVLNRAYNEALDAEDGKYRNMVERLVDESDIEIISVEHGGSVDEVLIDLAEEYIICTNDGEVRSVLRDRNLPHVYLRQRNHLEAANLHR